MTRTRKLRGADVYVTVAEVERAQDAAQLMACAIAFDRAGRNVPASMLRRLWGLRREWKKRTDVPAQVLAACQLLDRMAQQAPRTGETLTRPTPSGRAATCWRLGPC